MRSKNKPAQTRDEQEFCDLIAGFPCIVCAKPPPSEVHEFEQGKWFASVPLCWKCHRGPEGWHGTRLRWTLRKMTMLRAINDTLCLVFSTMRRLAESRARPPNGGPGQSGDS